MPDDHDGQGHNDDLDTAVNNLLDDILAIFDDHDCNVVHDEYAAACHRYLAAHQRHHAAAGHVADDHACDRCADAATHHLACRGHCTHHIYDSAHHDADDCDRYDRRNGTA